MIQRFTRNTKDAPSEQNTSRGLFLAPTPNAASYHPCRQNTNWPCVSFLPTLINPWFPYIYHTYIYIYIYILYIVYIRYIGLRIRKSRRRPAARPVQPSSSVGPGGLLLLRDPGPSCWYPTLLYVWTYTYSPTVFLNRLLCTP